MKFVKKYWPGIVAVLAIVFVVFLSILRGEKTRKAPPTPTPTPFGLENVYPPPGERPFPSPSLAVEFIFSKEIDPLATIIKIEPFVRYEVNTPEEKILSIYPPDGWRYEVEYTITLEPVSKEGDRLPAPIVHSFTPLLFTESDLEEAPFAE